MDDRRRGVRVMVAGALGVLALAGAAGAAAGSQADDLAVVRRAVQQPARTASARPQAAPDEVKPPEPPRLTGARDLRWFKVRIVETGAKRTKVTVNLPIGVVRAMEDWPIDLHCGRGARVRVKGREGDCSIRLGDILASLEAGQDLVTVESDDATVRVWVE
jgi:hypothetical protein